MGRDTKQTGLISQATRFRGYISNWWCRETGGSTTATFKLHDAIKPLSCGTQVDPFTNVARTTTLAIADGAAGNVTAGLHMVTVTVVTVYPGAGATGGETFVKGSAESSWTEFTAAGSKKAEITGIPTYSRADGQTPHATVVGRRIYVTKAGAPTTGVTPTNAQWFLITADLATTIAAGHNNAYLPVSTLTVADTTGFAAGPANLIVATDQGVEKVSYTAIGSGTTFTGCTGGKGKMATGGTVKQPMIGDNTSTTFSWNVADGSLAATQPPIIDTSGNLMAEVLVAASQTASDPMGGNVRWCENDGGVWVETGGSGTLSWGIWGGRE